MKTFARALALAVIYLAAAAMADWSLFVVAHDVYGVPRPLATVVAAVFDGAALACLNLASEAVREARSAAGPRLATVALAAVSVFLNVVHARHIHGGLPAALLFAAPTVALLIVSDLTWAATRARVRAERGERPMTLPVFGAWGWLLARPQAWQATRAKAAAHVGAQGAVQPRAAERHTATEVLRARFAEMDPAEAIRIAHEAQPALPPAELAALLVTYGVIVDVVQVALVLGHRGPAVEVQRAEPDAGDAHHDADQVGALPAPSKAAAILEAASRLGPDAPASDVAELVATHHGLTVAENYVRTVLSRQSKGAKKAGIEGVGQGGGGYA